MGKETEVTLFSPSSVITCVYLTGEWHQMQQNKGEAAPQQPACNLHGLPKSKGVLVILMNHNG